MSRDVTELTDTPLHYRHVIQGNVVHGEGAWPGYLGDIEKTSVFLHHIIAVDGPNPGACGARQSIPGVVVSIRKLCGISREEDEKQLKDSERPARSRYPVAATHCLQPFVAECSGKASQSSGY